MRFSRAVGQGQEIKAVLVLVIYVRRKDRANPSSGELSAAILGDNQCDYGSSKSNKYISIGGDVCIKLAQRNSHP